jgi:hypothetical protein
MIIERLPAISLCAATLLLAACGSSSRVALSGGGSGSSSGATTVPADGVAGPPQPLAPGLANTNCPPTGAPAVNPTSSSLPQLHCAP